MRWNIRRVVVLSLLVLRLNFELSVFPEALGPQSRHDEASPPRRRTGSMIDITIVRGVLRFAVLHPSPRYRLYSECLQYCGTLCQNELLVAVVSVLLYRLADDTIGMVILQ